MSFPSLLLCLLFAILLNQQAHAEIYQWKDADGRTHYSDRKPELEAAEVKKVTVKINSYTSVYYDRAIFDPETGSEPGPESAIGGAGNVVMYSTSWCGYCKKARRFFGKENIPYVDYDIEKDARAQQAYRDMGAKGVPVILVGERRMNGFSEKGFKKIWQ